MSSTIILYSGQARAFSQVWANHAFWIWRRFHNPVFVVSVADDANADSMLKIKDVCDAPFFFEKVKQPDIPEPAGYGLCKWHNASLPSSSLQAILKQFWSLNRAWEFYKENKEKIGPVDLIVRIRPDLCFARMAETRAPDPNTIFIPWFANWGGVNDRFAIMHPSAANAYFTTFKNRKELWEAHYCPVHPETMLGFNLQLNGIRIDRTLPTEFAIIRENGEAVQANFSASDQLEYARRGL